MTKENHSRKYVHALKYEESYASLGIIPIDLPNGIITAVSKNSVQDVIFGGPSVVKVNLNMDSVLRVLPFFNEPSEVVLIIRKIRI